MAAIYPTTSFNLKIFSLVGCEACNETFSAENGFFQSPNFPQRYPHSVYCAWRITVRLSEHVFLLFTSFNLQAQNNTDAVYVYDGENTTAEVLGAFYGSNPPHKDGIYSSSNQMLVVFKTDKNGSFRGFQASYHALGCSGRNFFCSMQNSNLEAVLNGNKLNNGCGA